ncbi:hypothetical protein Sros01_65540 [Streptomyces roseochromogenus]|nr:hypothetical protein Sros01_65540 [Streptomyces roseochromogenus]
MPGYDGTWAHPLPPRPAPGPLRSAAAEVGWMAGFLGPWLGRRLRGASSGDGRSAKRPDLLALDAPVG